MAQRPGSPHHHLRVIDTPRMPGSTRLPHWTEDNSHDRAATDGLSSHPWWSRIQMESVLIFVGMLGLAALLVMAITSSVVSTQHTQNQATYPVQEEKTWRYLPPMFDQPGRWYVTDQ